MSAKRAKRIETIVLGHPPIESGKGAAFLSATRRFQWRSAPLPVYPLITASAATALSNAGYAVHVIDALAEGYALMQWLDMLETIAPDLILFETKTPIIYYLWELIDSLKGRFPDLRVVLAGDHVTALPEESFAHSNVDAALTGGDYDFLLLNYITRINEGKGKFENGIYYRDETGVVSTGPFVLNHSLDAIPTLDRELTKWRRYAFAPDAFTKFPGAYIASARGRATHEPYSLSSVLYPEFRARSVVDTVDEIETLVATYGVKEIVDDSGTLPLEGWLDDFCAQMTMRKLNTRVAIDCRMPAGQLTFERYRVMRRAGFRTLYFDIEAATQKTLDKLQPGLSVSDIESSCKNAAKAGLSAQLAVTIGYPWEDERDVRFATNGIKRLLLKGYAAEARVFIATPYPGTAFFAECKNADALITEDWTRYDAQECVAKGALSTAALKKFAKEICLTHVHPRYLLHRIARVRSVSDIRRIGRTLKNALSEYFARWSFENASR